MTGINVLDYYDEVESPRQRTRRRPQQPPRRTLAETDLVAATDPLSNVDVEPSEVSPPPSTSVEVPLPPLEETTIVPIDARISFDNAYSPLPCFLKATHRAGSIASTLSGMVTPGRVPSPIIDEPPKKPKKSLADLDGEFEEAKVAFANLVNKSTSATPQKVAAPPVITSQKFVIPNGDAKEVIPVVDPTESALATALGQVLRRAASLGERALTDPKASSTSYLVSGAQATTTFLRRKANASWEKAKSCENPVASFGAAQTMFGDLFELVADRCFPDERTVPSEPTKDGEPSTRTLLKFTSRISGFISGMILAGVMTWAQEVMRERLTTKKNLLKKESERADKAEKWTGFILGALGAALSFAPLAGPGIAAVLGVVAPLITAKVKDHYSNTGYLKYYKLPDLTPSVLQLGASIEDSIYAYIDAHRNQGVLKDLGDAILRDEWYTNLAQDGELDINFVAADICAQLEKTMRHCGFAY